MLIDADCRVLPRRRSPDPTHPIVDRRSSSNLQYLWSSPNIWQHSSTFVRCLASIVCITAYKYFIRAYRLLLCFFVLFPFCFCFSFSQNLLYFLHPSFERARTKYQHSWVCTRSFNMSFPYYRPPGGETSVVLVGLNFNVYITSSDYLTTLRHRSTYHQAKWHHFLCPLSFRVMFVFPSLVVCRLFHDVRKDIE